MQVLVTGANGMLGQDLCPVLEDEGFDVIETDINNMDITNAEKVDEFFLLNRPEVVVHCAAYTNVDKAEEDLETAKLINIKGTENIAKACKKINTIMVYISTDYVFDGKSDKPYLPTDKTAPLNNYGMTKLEGEKIISAYLDNYYICRTSWLYGIHGNNFVEKMLMLAAAESEIMVIEDQIGCPTWTLELSKGIVKLLTDNAEYGIYHICGSGQTSWYNFAKEIFKQSALQVNLKPCLTKDYPSLAQRPAYSVMDNNKICKNWKISLKEYLELRLD